MSSLIRSATLQGYEAKEVQVEVDLLRRLPSISIVGMAGSAIRESADRVRSAILESNRFFPKLRVVINLAPAGLRKEGASFDLPIAMGILLKSGQIDGDKVDGSLFIGELSLSGKLRPIKGALSIALLAKKMGCRHVVLPKSNAEEASLATGISILGFERLQDVAAWLNGQFTPVKSKPKKVHCMPTMTLDMSEVKGQAHAKRGLEIAAAGCHNLLMIGPPGCGKTMMATRVPGILPALEEEEAIDITRIHSVAGTHPSGALVKQRPFRAPHHSISMAGMIGNKMLRPGEASLAHNGVLFLDELAEFRRDVLESLRGPLESGRITLNRSEGVMHFPAHFSLIAAANPCPCGYDGHPIQPCRCSEHQKRKYRNKISGPILDRIDIQIYMQPIPAIEMATNLGSDSSQTIQRRVEAARKTQRKRYKNTLISNNSQLEGHDIEKYCTLSDEANRIFVDMIQSHNLNGRSWARLLKLSRTISDLENSKSIEAKHLYEAAAFKLGLGQ